MQEFQAFLASTPIFAFFILCALYAIGEFIGTYTKAWIPSVFIIAILFLVGSWTFLPKDIVKMGGLGAPLGGIIAIMLAITHMGTAISLKELSKQWKVIVVCLAGLFGMVVFCLVHCCRLTSFDRRYHCCDDDADGSCRTGSRKGGYSGYLHVCMSGVCRVSFDGYYAEKGR